MKKAIKELIKFCRSRIRTIPLFENFIKEIKSESVFSGFFAHEMMLADKVRMNTYLSAINKYIKKGDVIIDLGTGTGILSFFATLKEPKKIYAIDHSDIIEKAKFIADCNNFKNIIFVKKNSKRFDIPEKVDLIMHEQMGSLLINENMVDNILDLRNRLLKENGKILPSKFELFIEPVKLKDECTIPLIWEQRFFNFSRLGKFKKYRTKYRTLQPHEVDYFLCDPKEVLSFDLEKVEDGNFFKKIYFTKKIKRNGRLDGFCCYFRTIFDKDISFSTSPFEKKTHWELRLFICEACVYKEGDSIKFDMTIKDCSNPSSWNWKYERI